MKHFIILAVLLLAACGGGGEITAAGPVTVNVTVEPGAITCNNCSVTLGPAGAASAPLPAASSPGPSVPPPASNAPLGTAVTQSSEYANTAGNLYWTSGGIGYQVRVATAADVAFVVLVSTTNPAAQSPTWQAEALLDNALDLHWPATTDTAIDAYLGVYVVPALNAWLTQNAGRFTGGMTFTPVSSQAVPASFGALQRIAALLPQRVQIINNQASLK